MKRFLAALQFLTIIPISCSCNEREIGSSTIFFPIVGMLVGIFVVGVGHVVGLLLPPLPSAVLIAITMFAVSGCLHMDGLADTADGFFSSRPRERILEIMKDSRTGSMGVVAVVSIFCLKVSAISSLPTTLRWPTLFLMPLAGRCALIFQMALLPYARPEGGLGKLFKKNTLLFPSIFALVSLTLCSYYGLGRLGLVTVVSTIVVTLLFSLWCKRKIGGYTGDTLGALCEIAELVPALVAVGGVR